MMSATIWIIAENKQFAAELVGGARDLGGTGAQVSAFVGGDAEACKEIITRGADVACAMPLPEACPWEDYAPVLAKRATEEKPMLILVGATKRGRDMAARLAGLLHAPCVSDAKSIVPGNGEMELSRMVYGGMAEKVVTTTAPTVLATVSAQRYSPLAVDDSRNGATETLQLEAGAVKVLGRMPKPKGAVNLSAAARVVGVGRGFAEEGELAMAKDLAAAMDAEVACSRPIAEFFKWLPEEVYVGISGQIIKPQVYLAVGISGQAQHTYGVRDAKCIVSVNKDENAPIFQVSDYFIVGDLNEVLPALKEAFNSYNPQAGDRESCNA
jgi:electron transfer flavoprotein alpha subunit